MRIFYWSYVRTAGIQALVDPSFVVRGVHHRPL